MRKEEKKKTILRSLQIVGFFRLSCMKVKNRVLFVFLFVSTEKEGKVEEKLTIIKIFLL